MKKSDLTEATGVIFAAAVAMLLSMCSPEKTDKTPTPAQIHAARAARISANGGIMQGLFWIPAERCSREPEICGL